MKIRTRFLLTGSISALILLVACVAVVVGVNDINALLRRSAHLGQLVDRLHVLRTLTLEYLQSPNERQEFQWHAQYRNISGSSPVLGLATADVNKAFADAQSLFELIVADTRAHRAPGESSAAILPYRRQLSSALLTDTQLIIDWAWDLSLKEHDRLRSMIRIYSLGAVLLLVLTFLISGLLLFPSALHTMRSVSTLKRGTDAIAAGRLDHRIELPGRDEFSELAQAFDAMTANLHASHTEMARINQALQTISGCGQIIVRAGDEIGLLEEVCKLAVTVGLGRFCWVGLIEPGADGRISPMARFGDAPIGFEFSAGRNGGDADPEPVTGAIRGGAANVIQDLAAPHEACAWRTAASAAGYQAVIGLPLVTGEKVLGGMGIYAGARNIFTPAEITLLHELAGDLAFGLQAVRDRVERNRNEEQLRLAKKELESRYAELKKLDVIKDGLVYDVTHELKTPVAKLAMQIEILRSTLDPSALAQVEKILETMERSVSRQQQVIKDMLWLAHLEAGGKKFGTRPLRIDELVLKVAEDYRTSLEAVGATLDVALEPLTVMGNEDMLWHVFSNLFNNAIKFRQAGEPLRIDIVSLRTPSGIVVRIKDNGAGIEAPDLARVFEKFYQATVSREGSGVGLSICKNIIEEMGGTIRLESDGLGQGTSALVTLPPG